MIAQQVKSIQDKQTKTQLYKEHQLNENLAGSIFYIMYVQKVLLTNTYNKLHCFSANIENILGGWGREGERCYSESVRMYKTETFNDRTVITWTFLKYTIIE